ncbi:MAG: WD40/YVTN/BNR-like repeat-containing protein [Nitrososphaerales archaeon]
MGKHHSDKGKSVSKKSSSKVMIIIGVVAAIVVGVGAAAYFDTSGGGGVTNNSLVGSWHDVHGVGVYDGTLHLATHNGLFKKADSGWEPVGNEKSDLMGFVISPAREDVMYSSGHPASMGGNLGFRKSTDGGQTWQTISPVTSSPVDFHAMDSSAADENLIYGSPGGGNDIYITHDEGKTWERLSPPALVVSLAADPADANVVYAGTTDGLFASNNQGKSWQKVNADLLEGVVTGLGFAGNTLYAYVMPEQGDGYIAKSLDAQTWAKTDGQIPGARGAWRFSGTDGEVYTILIQRTTFGATAASVYKSVDGGNSWTLEGTNNKSIVS